MPIALAILASALAMTLIVGVRYLLTSGGFALATRVRHPGLYRGLDAQMRREIAWSLASAAIYGIPAGVLAWGWQAHGWTRVYTDVDAMPLWYLPVSVFLYLFAHDTWFYWTHRWMHRPRPFRLAHAVHHASRPPTAWAAMAFHPIEALTGAVVETGSELIAQLKTFLETPGPGHKALFCANGIAALAATHPAFIKARPANQPDTP